MVATNIELGPVFVKIAWHSPASPLSVEAYFIIHQSRERPLSFIEIGASSAEAAVPELELGKCL